LYILNPNLAIQESRPKESRGLSPAQLSPPAGAAFCFHFSLQGVPLREYPDKEYVRYNCPFKDHEDRKPSFPVHKKGYCYGCQKKGNYW